MGSTPTPVEPVAQAPVQPTATQVAKKSNKKLLIIIAIVVLCLCVSSLIAIVAFVLPSLALIPFFSMGGQTITNNPLENTTENTSNNDSATSNPADDSNSWFDGYTQTEIPSDFPSDVKIYPNAVAYMTYASEEGTSVGFAVQASNNQLYNFYRTELEDAGWDILSSSNAEGYASFIASKGDRGLVITIGNSDDESSDTNYLGIVYY